MAESFDSYSLMLSMVKDSKVPLTPGISNRIMETFYKIDLNINKTV